MSVAAPAAAAPAAAGVSNATLASAGAAGAAAYAAGLTAEQVAQFERDGYLVLPDFFNVSTADTLKRHIDTLVAGIDLASHPRTVFKTTTSGAQTSQMEGDAAVEDKNKYFLDSADRIHYFFEEQAWGPDGQLAVPLSQAINKIGHALHTLDGPFSAFTHRAEVKALARSVGFKQPVVLQSMAILKQPRIGGQVLPHRDSTFLHTEPSTATGLWFALEDCTEKNGCLSFVPGSHKDGANSKRFVRAEPPPRQPSINNLPAASASSSSSSSTAASTIAAAADASSLTGPNNVGVQLEFVGEDRRSYAPEEFKLAEVKAGTLVLIHGEVVHASTHNHSDKSRYIYTFHMIEKEGTTYPTSNWLQSKQLFPTLNEQSA
jgi:ectoine hydroxylase-related dioxygenase (phytanoyl-CoA dioxygenase family)